MRFLKAIIESKLSASLGTAVRFDSVKLSLLGGSIECIGMSVADRIGSAVPLLSVERIQAEISIPRALKREIVIRSLIVERPILSAVILEDGKTNFPKRGGGGARMEGADPFGEEVKEQPKAWVLEASNIALREGAVRLEDRREGDGSYRISAEGIDATLTKMGTDVTLAMQARSVGRMDVPVELGPLDVRGKLTGIASLLKPAPATVEMEAAVGPGREVSVRVESADPAGRQVRARVDATVEAGMLIQLAPVRWSRKIEAFLGRFMMATGTRAAAEGQITAGCDAAYDPREGLRVSALTISAVDLTIGAKRV